MIRAGASLKPPCNTPMTEKSEARITGPPEQPFVASIPDIMASKQRSPNCFAGS